MVPARKPSPRRSADPTQVEPRTVAVGKARIFHYDVGEGPPVLLLHGFNHHADAWERNIAPIAAAGYRVIAIDLPGFGRSGVPEMSYSLRGYAGFVGELLDAPRSTPPTSSANSMGVRSRCAPPSTTRVAS